MNDDLPEDVKLGLQLIRVGSVCTLWRGLCKVAVAHAFFQTAVAVSAGGFTTLGLCLAMFFALPWLFVSWYFFRRYREKQRVAEVLLRMHSEEAFNFWMPTRPAMD